MSKGTVNKVILIGNLGADPEVRYMPNGNAVAGIRIATTEQWKDKNTGESQEHTEWHRISLFGKLGEIAGQYLKKGAKVYIEGKLRTRKWQDQSGQDRYSTDIIADAMTMLDSRPGGGTAEFGDSSSVSRPSGAGQRQPSAGPAPTAPDQAPPFDDDIPF